MIVMEATILHNISTINNYGICMKILLNSFLEEFFETRP